MTQTQEQLAPIIIPLSEENILLDTDSYKVSHAFQYKPGAVRHTAYLESRGGRYARTVMFGLQYILKRWMETRVTEAMVYEAAEAFGQHGVTFPLEQMLRIPQVHGGRLPLEIRALPEGSVVPVRTPLMTVTNTDPELPFLVGYFEALLERVWYPITVATQSWHIKQIIKEALERTSDHPEAELPYKLHDFGSRGVSSAESAAIGGAAHLVNFQGSDTFAGVRMLRNYYRAPMAAVSIPAAEHSTVTSWGKEGEVDAYRHALKALGTKGGLLAVVSDSYDLKNALSNIWGDALRQEVIDSGTTLVIRPDSGNPADMVRMTVNVLASRFGTTLNSKGYKVLNNVRVIQGDGINAESIREIIAAIETDGFSLTNVAFGMGGALLQQVDRDTQRVAYKLSAELFGDGTFMGVYKDPITDPGKRSKDGVLDVVIEDGKYVTRQYQTFDTTFPGSAMRTVYRDGEVLIEDDLETVRARAALGS
ncbi:nicotinate phosphoribosyltransferase [Deinococcus hopiensis]|uniref:Nicotinamide phosphoribosyltransferase n=1 Tax=Deinococcus hopiensis KR-140 TaxID=695939 RepID=A0A1W1ULV7_9DEIO|nr:nicotinate phosphoribosyltransferase [Deinococcus hopiensis]SMB82067.1 nicotinamide phosphoribosyltransferase [Deinococcus hopiensis KR-140]